MATTYTDNLNLQQPDLDDDALITVINNDMAIIDKAVNGVQDGLAIVANGNTHVAISAGQFVYVRNHTTLTEGLYVASSNIAANATLSTSNLTADSAGGLNALNSKIDNVTTENNSITISTGFTVTRKRAYKNGKVVTLDLLIQGNITSGDRIATLANPILPSSDRVLMALADNNNGTPLNGCVWITYGGNIDYYGSSYTNKAIELTATYVTA